jgi:hypothetical protein
MRIDIKKQKAVETLWKHYHVRESMLKALDGCKLINDNLSNEKLNYCARDSIIVNYCRSFKSGKDWAKLEFDIVPQEYRELHHLLIKLRDKLIAHRDFGFPRDNTGGEVAPLYIEVYQGMFTLNGTAMQFPELDIAAIETLCITILKAAESSIEVIRKEFPNEFPKDDGIFTLNTERKGNRLFKRFQIS